MDAERWSRIEQLCKAALERPEEQQEELLKTACADDPRLRQEVESLLAYRRGMDRFIEEPALRVAARRLAADESFRAARAQMIGRVISHYRIEEELASGGMGTVFRAVRADGTYDRQVAIKLIRSGFSADFFLHRFDNERHILASLDHPNIARLLDGGTTADGLPYLVMEYIQGQSIDAYCRQEQLSLVDRLRLFRTVCSAVQYAHQNLVVHRDLKPGNILVTGKGVPKLLDFGIAKILDPQQSAARADQTRTLVQMLTPDYASPEQIRNEPITTASDVYSLGVILYVLLTGSRPYSVKTSAPHEIMKAICDTEPEKPSAAVSRIFKVGADAPRGVLEKESAIPHSAERPDKLHRALAGDLDNIVLKALRKEPRRRYTSVEQFSEDIRRHLENLPVIAHKDTLSYRAGKFIRRHRAGVSAVALMVLSLAGGMIATLHEARIARFQQARAERRFNDVRALANSLTFDVHDAIQNLPGATSARQLLVTKALEYLDSLAQEANGDTGLQSELAAAYEKLARVQGNNLEPNLGKSAASIESYRKAVALREAVARARPADVMAQHRLQASYLELAMHLPSPDHVAASDYLQKSMRLAIHLAEAYPTNADFVTALALCYERKGMFLSAGNDLPAALDAYRTNLKLCRRSAELRDDDGNRTALSFAHKHVGAVLLVTGKLEEALAEYNESLSLDEALVKAHPNDANARFAITFTYSDIANIYWRQGDRARALAMYRKVLGLREAIAAADPDDHRARWGVANTCKYIGVLLFEQNDLEGALAYHRRSLAVREQLGMHDSDLPVAESLDLVGATYLALGEKSKERHRRRILYRQARIHLRRALPAYLENQAQGRLVGDEVGEPQKIAHNIAKCDAALAQLAIPH